MKRKALYGGSFDPLTNGHLDVIRQGLQLADEVVVAVGIQASKVPMFSFEERAELIEQSIKALEGADETRCSVISFDNLIVETAKEQSASILLRGLRDSTDFNYEMQMAGMNGAMEADVQTVFVPSSPGMGHITGTLVRQIAKMGGDVSPFVPNPVLKALKHKLS